MRRFVQIYVLAVTSFGALCGCRPAAPPRPNVLLVTLDTLRADHLGCYGYDRDTSPVIDALCGESVVFEQAIAQSAVTPVSHASILTGLEPYRHGLRSLHGGADRALPASRTTLAEHLAARGYATAGFVSAFPVTRHYSLDQGFEAWDQDFPGAEIAPAVESGALVDTGASQRRGDHTTERALAWLDAPRSRPFFLWVHYFDAHDPTLLPPKSYLLSYPPRGEGEKPALRALYDAEVAFVDTQIGRLLARLAETGLRDETIIAIVGDHGEGLGDHDWWGHCILYQEQVRVPFVLRLPGVAPARVRSTIRTTDLVPTLVEHLGLDRDGLDFDGLSLMPVIRGAESAPRLAYSESLNDLIGYREEEVANESLFALNDGRFKLIVTQEGGRDKALELYDLELDPHELTDVAEAHPEIVARLRDVLLERNVFAHPAATVPDEATRDRLRALGYVD